MSETLLTFDFGTRKIGVAVGQTETETAQGLTTLRCRPQSIPWAKIDALVETWQPDTLLVGIVILPDGRRSQFSKQTDTFCKQLASRYALPVKQVDERLTTEQADALIRDATPAGQPITNRRKSTRDKLAAELILSTYLADNRHS